MRVATTHTMRSIIHIQIANGSMTSARIASTMPHPYWPGWARTAARVSGRASSSMLPPEGLQTQCQRSGGENNYACDEVCALELHARNALAIARHDGRLSHASGFATLRNQKDVLSCIENRGTNERGLWRQLHGCHPAGGAPFPRVLPQRRTLHEPVAAGNPQQKLVILGHPISTNNNRGAR